MRSLLKALILFNILLTTIVNANQKNDYQNLLEKNTKESLDSLYSLLISNTTEENYFFINQFYNEAQKQESDELKFKSFKLLGVYYRNLNKPDSAKMIFNKAINFEFQDSKYNIKSKQQLASLMIILKEYDSAIELLNLLIEETKEKSNERAKVYSMIANVYRSNSMLDKALNYLNKAFEIIKDIGSKESIADMMINFIVLHAMNREFDKAEDYAFKAIELYKELGNNERIGDTYMNMGYISFNIGDYDEALDYFNNALKIEKESTNSAEDIVGLLINISSCYINLGKNQESIEVLNEINEFDENAYFQLNVIRKIKVAYMNLLQESLINNDIKSAKNNFSEFSNYYNKFDSISNIENSKALKQAIAEASIKFDNEILVNEKKLAEAQKNIAEKKVLFLVISLSIFVILLILLLFIYRKKNKLSNQLKERETKLVALNTELFDKIDMLIKSVAFKDKLLSVISHDLQSPIASISMLSDSLIQNSGKYDKNALIEKVKVFNDISSELNLLLNNLLKWIKSNSQSIDVNKSNFNICELADDIVKLYAKAAEENNIIIHNNIKRNVIVNADKNMIATVIRNLLSNAIKFSDNNKKIELNSALLNDKIKISIKDEGKGIEPEKLSVIFKKTNMQHSLDENSGLGLKISKEFVELNEGEIFVKSDLGIGSEFGFVLDKSRTN